MPPTQTTPATAAREDPLGGAEPAVSVVIPCLNEAENIARCVTAARDVLAEHGIDGEVVVADNASEDDSARLAAEAGARVVHEPRRGYGSAYLAGFQAARGRYIVMADADLTYDFREIPRFVEALEDGGELVMGDRMDNIRPGAMPWLHRYVGNPVLTGVLNLFFRTGVSDAHCGMRAIRRDVLPVLDLRTTGMEFASEMVIRAAKEGLDIRQFPIEYHPRSGESKLSSFRDGWRHLRFLLVHSPTHLFLVPGAILALLGVLVSAISVSGVEVLRPRVAAALDGRGRPVHDRRHPGRGARAVRARLRHVLHGREGPVVRPDAGPLPPRARPRARRRDHARRLRDGAGDRGALARARTRGAVRGAARGARGEPDHRRHPGLLLVVPAEHPRAAPRRLTVRRLREAPLLVVALGALLVAAVAASVGVRIEAIALDETIHKQQAAHYAQGFPSALLHDSTARSTARLYSLVLAPLFALFDGDVAVRLSRR